MVQLDKMADTIETVGRKFLPGSILVSTSIVKIVALHKMLTQIWRHFITFFSYCAVYFFPAQRDTKTIILHSLMM